MRKFMSKIYHADVLEEKIQEVHDDDEDDGHHHHQTYGVVCFSSKYKKSTWVGCALAILQQMTGINFIMFYSNTLFAGSSMSPQNITGLIGVVNFLATFGGLFFLALAGRRTIMLYCNTIMSIILISNGIFNLQGHQTWAIITTMLFICFFEFSSGPITWLYMAEIMADKAVGIATVLNWTVNLVISIITPSLINAIGSDNVGWIFIVMGGFTVLGTVFMFFFMLETRNKTSQEIKAMFRGLDPLMVSP